MFFSLIALAMGEYGEAGRGCLNRLIFAKPSAQPQPVH
jgi:hypothetical protein